MGEKMAPIPKLNETEETMKVQLKIQRAEIMRTYENLICEREDSIEP